MGRRYGRADGHVRWLQDAIVDMGGTPEDMPLPEVKPPGKGRDAERSESVARVTAAWHRALDRLPATRRPDPALDEVRWMLEELRVSYFAQSLGTAHPVSEKRVLRAIDRLGG